MAHPQMFRDDDPVLDRLRRIALELPGADCKVSHGRPAFFTSKVFGYYGGALKVGGEWVQHEHAVLVLPDESDRPALLEDPRVWVPAYLGGSGWLGLDLVPDPDRVDWVEVVELLDASYRRTAPARLVRELDARSSG